MDQLEMNPTQPQTQEPPPFKSVTEDLAKPLDDQMVRNAIAAAEQAGTDVVDLTQQTAQTPPEPAPVVPAPTPKVDVPAKFQKPDGTVDVDKLKASTKQLDEAIQQKQIVVEKTVDDYLAEYREKEKQFHSIPSNPDVIRQQAAQQAPPPAPAPQAPAPAINQQPGEDPAALKARIAQDLQVDPVATIIDLIHVVGQKQVEPLLQDHQARIQQERDNAIRRNISEIATQDRRILNPQVFEEVNRELNSDPAYWRLKNPHKAAWLEVKERLRLGDPSQPAQPGRPTAPILGGGTPPPVPSASGHVTPRALIGAIGEAKTADERSALEQQIRSLLGNMD